MPELGQKRLFPLGRAEPAVEQPQGKPEPSHPRVTMIKQWSSWEHGAGPSDPTSTQEGRGQNVLHWRLKEGLDLRSVDARGANWREESCLSTQQCVSIC